MRNHLYRRVFAWVLIVVILATSISCSEGNTQAIETTNVYLPTVYVNSYPNIPPIFGIQVPSLLDPKVLASALDSDTYWVRFNAMKWSSVQPNGPEDNPIWDVNLDEDLVRASSNGLQVILNVISTPTWAQQYPGYFCGPIKPEQLPAFASFMSQVVSRYSVPPYNVQYYEIWNEPDVDYRVIATPNSPYGCWGNKDDYYYGGNVYTNMLKFVYPAMKAANPSVKILIGGLLLDCDPTNIGPTGCVDDAHATAPRFFEGVLRDNGLNDGANYFDIVSFHGYTQPLLDFPYPIQSEINYPTWSVLGGVVQGKITYLRNVMSQYQVDKPIIHTEAAYITQGVDSSEFEQNKADYVVWVFTRNMSQRLWGTTWYTLNGPGWRFGGLLDENQDPLPAYHAYKYMIEELTDMKYVNNTQPVPEVTQYNFTGQHKQLQVYFSMDGAEHTINAPVGWTAIYDLFGTVITPTATTLEVIVQHPLYIELGQ